MIRQYGMGYVFVDQSASLLSKVAFANSYATLALSQKLKSDIMAIAGAMNLTDEQKESLTTLPIGSAVVRLADVPDVLGEGSSGMITHPPSESAYEQCWPGYVQLVRKTPPSSIPKPIPNMITNGTSNTEATAPTAMPRPIAEIRKLVLRPVFILLFLYKCLTGISRMASG